MRRTLLLALAAFVVAARGDLASQAQPYTTWDAFGGSKDSMQYSALTQINKSNVAQLELVWFYPAPGEGGPGRFSFSPLVVDGVMYVGGRNNAAVVALDAATGKELWTYPTEGRPTDRGYAWWRSKDGRDRRLIFASNSYLQELDMHTGKPIASFGENGRVNLRLGLGQKPARGSQCNSPGHVFENLIILGACTGEGYDDPPGWMRAYDVLSGELVWTFHTVPLPGEYGYETWPPDAWKNTGGANTWVNFSIDEKRGIGYFPTGSPTYDFYGARRKGANLFGNTLLALDLRTGKRLWHFQLLHHDLWDYDLATEPKLLTVKHNGKTVDIVAQGTKFGMLYVFNRVTGEPLWPIEERPVPKSDVPGEEAYPTQPFQPRLPPYSRLKMTVDDINPYVDSDEHERLRKTFLAARHEGVFTPLTHTRDQIQLPGEYGGTNWAGMAGDPETGMVVVRAENTPTIHRLFEKPPTKRFDSGTPEQQGSVVWSELCASCHGPAEVGVKALSERNPSALRSIVREGFGNMSGFGYSDLAPNDANIDALIAYILNPSAGGMAPGAASNSAGESSDLPPNETRRFFGQFGHMWLADNGLPAIAPPWSELVAYDLNEGTIKWRVPLGTAAGLAAKGITNTGSFHPTRNGPVITAGGLIFMGTDADRTVRAYDKDNGKILWQREIESNPQSIPAVFQVAGRQYVAFFASSGRAKNDVAYKQGKPEAQGYYVFALPRQTSRVQGIKPPNVHQDDTDGEEWIRRLERPDRLPGLKTSEVIAALQLKPGDVVADIGAGTGAFTIPFAKAVGPSGTAFAVDIWPDLLKYIDAKARREQVGNLRTILAARDNPHLPARQVDLAFFHDVFHNVNDRQAYLNVLASQLKPGGRIAIIEQEFDDPIAKKWDRPEDRITREQVRGWMTNAGFRLAAEFDLFQGSNNPQGAGMPERWFVLYERAARPTTVD